MPASLLPDASGHSIDESSCLAPVLENSLGCLECRHLTALNCQLLLLLGGDLSHSLFLSPRWEQTPLLDQLAAAGKLFLTMPWL